MLDFGAAQPGIRSLHIAHDDRDVLERVIVSAHVRGNWSSPRCQELHEFQMLFSKSQPHQPQAQAEKAEQLLIVLAEHLSVRLTLELEHARVELHGSIHVGGAHSAPQRAAQIPQIT